MVWIRLRSQHIAKSVLYAAQLANRPLDGIEGFRGRYYRKKYSKRLEEEGARKAREGACHLPSAYPAPPAYVSTRVRTHDSPGAPNERTPTTLATLLCKYGAGPSGRPHRYKEISIWGAPRQQWDKGRLVRAKGGRKPKKSRALGTQGRNM